jgi:hypothetical protein
MSYFRELPDLFYQSPLSTRNSSKEYVRIKNLFRRVKLRDDLQNVFTLFNKYSIREGERPDTIAENLYGASDLDWVIMMTAGIINLTNDWPLSNYDLYTYADNKYGNDLNSIRFYETTEVKDSSGRLLLPKGKIVDSDFTIPNPDIPALNLNPVTGITNYEYEVRVNDEKSNIFILKPEYLQVYLADMRRIMQYEKSSEYINRRLAATENTRNTSPQ